MKFFVVLIFVCNFSYIFCNIQETIYSDEEVRITSVRTEDENQRPELENSNRLEEDDDHADDEYNMQADEPMPASDSDNEAAFDTNAEANSEISSTTEDTPSSSQYDNNDGELISSTTTESFLEEITTDVASNSEKLDVSENMLEQDILSKTTTEITAEEENSSVTVPSDTINQVEDGVPSEKYRQVNVNKLSDQIRIVLKNYKDSGNVVVPNITIPDPMSIPDTYRRISMVSMNLKNQMVYGLSNFTVQHINTDLEKKQVFVMLHMKRLVILGNYSMSSLFSKASGPFNVTLLDVITEGAAALNYTADGSLEATQTDMDMSFRDVKLDFKNLGIMGSFFQGVLGAVGNLVFEGVKPVILTEVNTNMKDDINVKIRAMTSGIQSNTSVSPIDQAVLEGRRYVKRQGYDPYHLANFTTRVGLFNVNISKFQLEGLSKFYRVGDVGLSMDNGTVEFGVHVATDKLVGNCSWSVFLGKKLFRNGTANFTIDHIQGRGNIRQSLDLKNRLNLHDLDFFVGDINLTTERKDAIDLFIEQVANKLPKIIKHAVVDGIEEPVKFTVQKILDLVDVEKIVDQQLPILDKLGYR